VADEWKPLNTGDVAGTEKLQADNLGGKSLIKKGFAA
jgi:hypothetical protein